MELDGGGGGSTQHVLEGQNFVLVFRRQTRFLLLEDGQGEDVAAKEMGQTDSFRLWLQRDATQLALSSSSWEELWSFF